MKIGGKSIASPLPEIVVIPREEGNVVIKCKAVLDYAKFDAVYPEPQPPTINRPGQAPVQDRDDAGFKAKVEKWGEARSHFLFIESLSATPGLVWETVDLKDATTYGNYRKELEQTFAPGELGEITNGIMKVNGLDETTMKEARDAFLAGPQETEAEK